MAHQKIYVLSMWQKKSIILLIYKNNNKSNYLHFLLQSDFLKNQVPVPIYKDFWYQELTNQMQPYYATWPIKCSHLYDLYTYGSRQGVHAGWLLCWLLSFFYLTVWVKKSQYPWLNSQVLHTLKILAANQLKITGLDFNRYVVICRDVWTT